jgi:hypothetical protein
MGNPYRFLKDIATGIFSNSKKKDREASEWYGYDDLIQTFP